MIDQSRRRYAWCASIVLALSVTLLLPGFVFSHPRPDFTPFFPKDHPHGAFGLDALSALEYLKALVLRRPNLDVWRPTYEVLVLAAALLVTTGWGRARALRWGLAFAYAGLLLVLVYHHAFAFTFETKPALWEDVMLVENLLHFLGDAYHPLIAALAVLGLLLSFVGCMALVQFVLERFQSFAAPSSFRARATTAAVLVSWGTLSLSWFGVARNDPVVQLPGKALAANYRSSLERKARVEEVFGPVVDRRYQPFMDARLERRPTVHLLMIESYGVRLVVDPQMRGPFEELSARVMRRLGEKGFHARTAASRAPVFGGRSWLSIGTVQTGVRLEQPSLYKLMEQVAARLPTLTRFFKANDYRTVALQPGNRVRATMGPNDVFERDEVLEGPDIGYTGPHYDWGQIPDQYSMNVYRERVLAKSPAPYFSYFMSVSTHHRWPTIPFAKDWHLLNTPELAEVVPYEPIAGVERIKEGKPRKYFESIVYEWRVLMELIESEPDPDAIFFVVGDHQPLIERTTDAQVLQDIAAALQTQSANTPVHVIARDEAFVNRFAERGFVEGLVPKDPEAPGLNHEGLFSLFVTELVGAYGERGHSARVRYIPEGLSVSTLSPLAPEAAIDAGVLAQ